jgi:cytochrome c6
LLSRSPSAWPRRWVGPLAWALTAVLALLGLGPLAGAAAAADLAHGAQLFEAHCVGCHVGGGNIIRRGRTLKLQALQRQGLDSAEAIATVAAGGLGQMSGYREALGGDGGAEDVAAWVWQQALQGWQPS